MLQKKIWCCTYCNGTHLTLCMRVGSRGMGSRGGWWLGHGRSPHVCVAGRGCAYVRCPSLLRVESDNFYRLGESYGRNQKNFTGLVEAMYECLFGPDVPALASPFFISENICAPHHVFLSRTTWAEAYGWYCSIKWWVDLTVWEMWLWVIVIRQT